MRCFQYFRVGPGPAYPLYDVAVLGWMRIAKVSPYALVYCQTFRNGRHDRGRDLGSSRRRVQVYDVGPADATKFDYTRIASFRFVLVDVDLYRLVLADLPPSFPDSGFVVNSRCGLLFQSSYLRRARSRREGSCERLGRGPAEGVRGC